MKTRYRLIRRGLRGGAFYCVDSSTGKRVSLGKLSREEAEQIVYAKNQSQRQPALNLQIAKAYLAGTDNGITTRTWNDAITSLIQSKNGSNQVRWKTAARDKAFADLLPRVILETNADTLLQVMHQGKVSTIIFLRKLHSFCLNMNWLPWPIIPTAQWPAVKHKDKRAITLDEHYRILSGERNPEWHAYYELLWHLGGAQSDVATLRAEDIDWQDETISYTRCKTGNVCVVHFGKEIAQILSSLPGEGFLFPMIALWKQADRGKAFIRRCRLVQVSGVSLHSYRYAWAERAKSAGYPERFAQMALGHNSKAVHRAYAKKAQVILPPLEEFEARNKTVMKKPVMMDCSRS